jgi:hypothetical protein
MDDRIGTLLNNAIKNGVMTVEQMDQLTERDMDMLEEVDEEGMARFVFRRFVETPEERLTRLQDARQRLDRIMDELRVDQAARADAVVAARAELDDRRNIAAGPMNRNPTPLTGGRKRSQKRGRKNRPTKKPRR